MDHALAVDEVESALAERRREDRRLDDVQEPISPEILPGRIDGVTEVDPHELALAPPRHMVGDATDADPHFEDHLVPDAPPINIEHEIHACIHIIWIKIPVGAAVPLVIEPFPGEGPKHVPFAGHGVLARHLEARGLAAQAPAKFPEEVFPDVRAEHEHPGDPAHDRVADLPLTIQQNARFDLSRQLSWVEPHPVCTLALRAR